MLLTATRSAAVAAGATLVIVTLTACGGGTRTVALPVLVNRVNAICGTYTVRIEALRAPSFAPESATTAELGAAATYLDAAVPLLQSEKSSIEAVGLPQTDRSMYQSVLTALAAHVRNEAAAQTAAHGKDLRAFHAAVAADQAASTRLAGVAQQFGLTKCV